MCGLFSAKFEIVFISFMMYRMLLSALYMYPIHCIVIYHVSVYPHGPNGPTEFWNKTYHTYQTYNYRNEWLLVSMSRGVG